MKQDYLLLGEIVRPQGIRGEVKVRHYTDDPERFYDLDVVFLRRGESYEEKNVEDARVQGDDVHLPLRHEDLAGIGGFRNIEGVQHTALFEHRRIPRI